MKIFRSEEIREIDAATIRLEPVTSAGLMERAATTLFQRIRDLVATDRKISVFAGPGNNGGDGLVLARLMHEDGFQVKVFTVETGSARTDEFLLNAGRLERSGVVPTALADPALFPSISSDEIIIDALFGTGLSRPASGAVAEIIRLINKSGARVISIDIPSGLFSEDNSNVDHESVVMAWRTLSIRFPRLAFMFPGNGINVGEWESIDIGLHTETILTKETPYYYITRESVRPLLKVRGRFDHKGLFGHALLIAGSEGKTGAATLAAGAALRTGAGLVTVHTPATSVSCLQASLPEAMVSPDPGAGHVIMLPDLSPYEAIGAGPGMGTDPDTAVVLRELLEKAAVPLVLDADALNILSANREWLKLLSSRTVITPHPAEFRRLTGSGSSDYRLMQEQRAFAADHGCVVVLKGAHTSVALPNGRVYFNSTGNPGMATAGSGDVLTGMITALLAQGYHPSDAAIAAVFLHGLAGDIALRIHSEESVIAGDILMNIGRAFRETHFNSLSVYL